MYVVADGVGGGVRSEENLGVAGMRIYHGVGEGGGFDNTRKLQNAIVKFNLRYIVSTIFEQPDAELPNAK